MSAEYRVTAVPTEHCAGLWGGIRYLFEPAVKRSHNRWTMPQLYESLISGKQNLWLAYNQEGKISGVATTMIANYPNNKMLAVQFLGGERFEEWFNDILELIEAFARDCGCDGVEAAARFGFWRFLKQRNYTRPFVTYELFFRGLNDE